MSLVSFKFLFFCALLLLCYFIAPKKWQWIILLLFSLAFYAFAGIQSFIYIGITALSAWLGALYLEKIGSTTKEYINIHRDSLTVDEKTNIKKIAKRKKKFILVLVIVLNFVLLGIFKYANFAIDQINSLIGIFNGSTHINSLTLIVPLGISFYTFQTMGYLIDVYWGKNEACRNPLKMLLFTSFFPQITQGPISNYQELSQQLYSSHNFEYNNWSLGCERMIWGFFKKIAIADLLSPYVQSVFTHYSEYSGITVLVGMVFYSIQIYADFSGYMDIVCGLCQIMGIKLTENFDRPYFSKSIAEYWRRWHISLGTWFKSYIYYPIAVSKWNNKIGKWASEKFGKSFGKNLPASIALVAVWFTTGLWHGANWGYICWGGLNGVFIIISMWLEPLYIILKRKLKIKDSLWRYVQVIRTFILVTFIKVLPEVGGLKSGLALWKQALTEHSIPCSFESLLPFASKGPLLIIITGTILMLIISLFGRNHSVREEFNKRVPLVFRLFILAILITVSIISALYTGDNGGGFMYAQF